MAQQPCELREHRFSMVFHLDFEPQVPIFGPYPCRFQVLRPRNGAQTALEAEKRRSATHFAVVRRNGSFAGPLESTFPMYIDHIATIEVY